MVLAGVGLALMTNSAVQNNHIEKIKIGKARIIKRAIFLLVIGLIYMPIWPADILHFYGVYMAITVLFITVSPRITFGSAFVIILIYPLSMMLFDYEMHWNFETMTYFEFWSLDGFVRNLFHNGFHPVLPWVAFMLIGLWFGKQELTNDAFVKKAMWRSLGIFIIIQILSYLSIELLSEGDSIARQELQEILGASPMPPLPVYMFSGSALAISIISICILIANKFENSPIVDALYKTGQLALTFYVAHVIVGMGVVYLFIPEGMGVLSLEMATLYAFGFSIACILFAIIWRKYKETGPLEWIMRKLTD